MEVIIKSTNATRNFSFDNGTTLEQLIAHDSVQEFFGAEPSEIQESLVEIDGAAIAEAVKPYIISAALRDGMELTFDLESEENDEHNDETAQSNETEGIVTVYTSGGLQNTIVNISVGVTTVREAIYNNNVRARSGMTDAQLSNCVVTLNDEELTSAMVNTKTLASGDVITLTARSASTKGATSIYCW